MLLGLSLPGCLPRFPAPAAAATRRLPSAVGRDDHVARPERMTLRQRPQVGHIQSCGNIVAFVRHDSTIPILQETAPVPLRFELTQAELRDRYLETHGNGSLKHQTARGIRRHFRRLDQRLGEGFPIRELFLADL